MDAAAIAKVAFTSEDRVRDVIRNFNADGFGSLYPEYKGGRPPKFSLPQRREIKKIANSNPAGDGLPFSAWSLPELAEFLVAQGWSTLEQGDTDRLTAASRNAALAIAKANVTAQAAAVNRLQQLSGFEEIKAPFDGVVTARNVNVGDLLNAGGTTGRALYQVADIHRMRIFVNVPQAFLGELKPGVKATLHLPGQQETFEAELSSTSNALEETSRTALIELQANNPDGKLWPGAFTEVQFHIPSNPNTLRIVSTALIFGTNGMRVAAVDANNKVVLKSVRLGRDLGNHVEIQSGLSLTDRLIDNPQESIEAGTIVRIAGPDAKVAAAE